MVLVLLSSEANDKIEDYFLLKDGFLYFGYEIIEGDCVLFLVCVIIIYAAEVLRGRAVFNTLPIFFSRTSLLNFFIPPLLLLHAML